MWSCQVRVKVRHSVVSCEVIVIFRQEKAFLLLVVANSCISIMGLGSFRLPWGMWNVGGFIEKVMSHLAGVCWSDRKAAFVLLNIQVMLQAYSELLLLGTADEMSPPMSSWCCLWLYGWVVTQTEPLHDFRNQPPHQFFFFFPYLQFTFIIHFLNQVCPCLALWHWVAYNLIHLFN